MKSKTSGSSLPDRIKKLSAELGIHAPNILLPSPHINIKNWPVIACDQYTSSPDYWNKVNKRVNESKGESVYNIVLPEIYLEDPEDIPIDDRIKSINKFMKDYYKNGVFTSFDNSIVFVDRATPMTPSRKGLVLAIDLDSYDFKDNNQALIRATEGTVIERIPPRLKIRANASLETPHIMLLVDDRLNTIIGPIAEGCSSGKFNLLYDTDLPDNGGHVKGYQILGDTLDYLNCLIAMSELNSYKKRGLLFAVGDGNHSLATAKAHWEKIRSVSPPDHPARYAMVEIVNIYDEGLTFEPIHRILFDTSSKDFISFMKNNLSQDLGIKSSDGMSLENALTMTTTLDQSVQPFIIYSKGHSTVVTFDHPLSPFTVGSVQFAIDEYIKVNPKSHVDYIHGQEELVSLSEKGIGILLPAMHKEDFFDIIAKHGSLPRKTFSMGEADEKRFYMECRLII